MKLKESLFHDWLLPVTFPKKGESGITVYSHTMLFIAGFASRTQVKKNWDKATLIQKKENKLKLIFWMCPNLLNVFKIQNK